jgi:hypothetical protein
MIIFICFFFQKKQQSRTKPIPVARHLYEARVPEAAESGGEDTEVASWSLPAAAVQSGHAN